MVTSVDIHGGSGDYFILGGETEASIDSALGLMEPNTFASYQNSGGLIVTALQIDSSGRPFILGAFEQKQNFSKSRKVLDNTAFKIIQTLNQDL